MAAFLAALQQQTGSDTDANLKGLIASATANAQVQGMSDADLAALIERLRGAVKPADAGMMDLLSPDGTTSDATTATKDDTGTDGAAPADPWAALAALLGLQTPPVQTPATAAADSAATGAAAVDAASGPTAGAPAPVAAASPGDALQPGADAADAAAQEAAAAAAARPQGETAKADARAKRISEEIDKLTGGTTPVKVEGRTETKPAEPVKAADAVALQETTAQTSPADDASTSSGTSQGQPEQISEKKPFVPPTREEVAARLVPQAADDRRQDATPAADGASGAAAGANALPAGTTSNALSVQSANAQTSQTATVASTVPLHELGEAVARHARSGDSRFEIRLSPADLGRIDVSLTVSQDGTVRAHMAVERADTLDMMLRDQGGLARSLEQNGLNVDSSGLQFSLQQQSGGNAWRDGSDGTQTAPVVADATAEAEPEVVPIPAAYQWGGGRGGIDLRV